jgi:hypothetical protein
MVVILHQRECRSEAERCAADTAAAFKDHVTVLPLEAGAREDWPADVQWDDLLVVFYQDSASFPAEGNQFIANYLHGHPGGAMLLPVATTAARKPPDAAAAIKALQFDAAAAGVDGRLVRRIGAMLGLRVQGRDFRVFVSYRAADGTAIAAQLEAYLRGFGYPVFLDEGKELDGETKILPGSAVQSEIDEALAGASLVLLIDTPAAPESIWIKHEVDTADGLLLPILPLCFRATGDKKRGPRFRSLLALQRWVSLELPSPGLTPPLTDEQLAQIVGEAEDYICEIFRRKCRVPFLVEKEFVSRGFAWTVLDRKLLMFESSKAGSARLKTKVSSHCSVFDQIYEPALQRFCAFLEQSGRGNYSLFIYDGAILPDHELEAIVADLDDVIVLHHQELAVLLDTNFQALRVS